MGSFYIMSGRRDSRLDAKLCDAYLCLGENENYVQATIKIALDMEIAAYRTLLEGEESRLGLSQSEDPTWVPSYRAEGGGRIKKRKRLQEESYVGVSLAQEYMQPKDLLIEQAGRAVKVEAVEERLETEPELGEG